jgi:hypothetical protein
MTSQPPTYQPAASPPQPRRDAPWLALFAVDAALSVITLVVFGVFGGLFMLLALNGFDGRRGGAILVGYAVVVLAGNALCAGLINWMILRVRQAVSARAVLVPALATTAVMLIAGPPVAVVLIKLLFGGRTF